MSKINIDWDRIEQVLPSGLDPDSRSKRLKVFKKLDPSGNKLISSNELEIGLRPVLAAVGDDLKPYFPQAMKCAFNRARNLQSPKPKKRASCTKQKGEAHESAIDKTEFHAFIIAFRKYLELAALFVKTDASGDQRVNHAECKKALPLLNEWGIDALDEEFHFKYTESVSFEAFAEWCVRESMEIATGSTEWVLKLDNSDNEEVQLEKNKIDMREHAGLEKHRKLHDALRSDPECTIKIAAAFRQFDVDRNGMITEDELTKVFTRLSPDMSADAVKSLIVAADKNKDGCIDYQEFTTWLFYST